MSGRRKLPQAANDATMGALTLQAMLNAERAIQDAKAAIAQAIATAPNICSFCGRPRPEVRVLVAGPTVKICDSCVKIAADIIAVELEEENKNG